MDVPHPRSRSSGDPQAQGLLVLGSGIVVTTGALAFAADLGARGRSAELVVLTAANLIVTAGRFAAFRLWVFRAGSGIVPHSRQPAEPAALQPVLGQSAPYGGDAS